MTTKWAWTAAGTALLCLVAFEVYATILRARKRPGPLSTRLNHGLWWLASTVAFQLDRKRRHVILSAVGPLLLPILGALLILTLVVGFGLIYLPRLPSGFSLATTSMSPWQDAVYFSGVTLLTIGYGDITPHSGPLRFAALVEGVAGIAVLSLATAYLLTIYGAVERKRAAALAFYHQAGRGADVASFIAHHFRRGRFIGFDAIVRVGARDLQVIMEAHIEHPVIHYFHSEVLAKSFPRMVFLLLETATIVGTCLDPAAHAEVCDHPDVETLDDTALDVVEELLVVLQLGKRAKDAIGTPDEDCERHRRCFRRTVRRLAAAGITVRADQAGAFQSYVAARERWERKLACISRFLGYDWDEVSGDKNLDDAAAVEAGT